MTRLCLRGVTLALAFGGMCLDAPGQVVLRGLSVYGMGDEQLPPVIGVDSTRTHITIQFDVVARHPPDLRIRFLHCDRNWVPEGNAFVQDEGYTLSSVLSFKLSPPGVEHYTYRYVNTFPDSDGVVRFLYSGNWVFRISDLPETRILGEGRFFVVENMLPASMTVRNDWQTDLAPPFNQVHRVDLRVMLPEEVEGMYIDAADVYRNRLFRAPRRIDAGDTDPLTLVTGLGSGMRTFTVRNIHPGNEYRVLDMSDPGRYPNRDTVRRWESADLPRALFYNGPDRDGVPVLNRYTGTASDYLPVLFRLDLSALDPGLTRGRQVYLVGSFNNWAPRPADSLGGDARRLYASTRLLRRGIYDYQYVLGRRDERRGEVVDQDWMVLEGNDWRTTNTYMACVYYRDPRYGGFDRIAGFASVRSGGESGASQ